MALFRCSMLGVSPSGRAWSSRLYFSSGHTLAQVEANWLTEVTRWWNDATTGVKTIFPTATVLETTRSAAISVVTVGAVDKLRETSVLTDNPALPGTSVNAGLTDQDSVLFSLRTLTAGREGRGRMRLPAPDETLVISSELTSAAATRVSTATLLLLTNMGGLGHTPVLVTAVKTKIGTPVGTTRNITTGETDRVIRSARQRSKRRRAVYI